MTANAMPPRPTSITLIGWIMIVMNIVAIIALMCMSNDPEVVKMMNKSPLPLSVQEGLAFLHGLAEMVSGIAMLYRKNCARVLFVGAYLTHIIIGLLTLPSTVIMIPGIISFIVEAFFLFRPIANEYFAKVPEQ